MAERKKKKQPRGLRGMPKGPVQSRIPSKSAKGQAGKKAVAKKAVAKPKKRGVVASLKARRAKRASQNKWVLGEKLTKAGRKRATARKGAKRLKKAGVTVSAKTAAASGKVRKGAVGAKVTKGGGVAYAKYKKGSKAAKSFGSAFKSGCAGGAKSFSWDGRSYSCAKKASPKKAGTAKTKQKVSYPTAKEVSAVHPRRDKQINQKSNFLFTSNSMYCWKFNKEGYI